MNNVDTGDIGEAFLNANARPQYIQSRFAEVVQYIIRAIVARDVTRSLYTAAEIMDHVEELRARFPGKPNWHDLFEGAITQLRQAIPEDLNERRCVNAAQEGTKYLIDLMSGDSFAAARTAKSFAAFQQAIELSQEVRTKHKNGS